MSILQHGVVKESRNEEQRLRRSIKGEEETPQVVCWRKTLPAGGMAIATNTLNDFSRSRSIVILMRRALVGQKRIRIDWRREEKVSMDEHHCVCWKESQEEAHKLKKGLWKRFLNRRNNIDASWKGVHEDLNKREVLGVYLAYRIHSYRFKLNPHPNYSIPSNEHFQWPQERAL